jgi:MoxR-like ATPase
MMFRVYRREAYDILKQVEVENGRDERRGAGYQASAPLENAVNVALALGRPLLVSGEPGCGKTELGFSVARKLGIARVYFFSVKSDGEARRLFYSYDTVGRFHAAQIGQARPVEGQADASSVDPRHFIEYQALGRAILDAYDLSDVAHLLGTRYSHPGQPQRSVVIVDEVDKAPRDFPNDLLNEIDQFWFRVPELCWGTGGAIPETPRKRIGREVQPFVVITSNSERQLPDAFLRRCIFHHITFPDPDTLRVIVDNRLAAMGITPPPGDVVNALDLVVRARQERLEKLPGTAELLDFLQAVSLHGAEAQQLPWTVRFAACLQALAKTEYDERALLGLLPTDVVGA